MIARYFRDRTKNQLHRGAFRRVEELIAAIDHYIDRDDVEKSSAHTRPAIIGTLDDALH